MPTPLPTQRGLEPMASTPSSSVEATLQLSVRTAQRPLARALGDSVWNTLRARAGRSPPDPGNLMRQEEQLVADPVASVIKFFKKAVDDILTGGKTPRTLAAQRSGDHQSAVLVA